MLVEQADPSPNDCNAGGTKQACYAASQAMVSALNSFASDLAAAHVPSRYVTADADVKTALATLILGYQRRNHGIANNIDADFVSGNDILKRANTSLWRAYEGFPVDARPTPAVS